MVSERGETILFHLIIFSNYRGREVSSYVGSFSFSSVYSHSIVFRFLKSASYSVYRKEVKEFFSLLAPIVFDPTSDESRFETAAGDERECTSPLPTDSNCLATGTSDLASPAQVGKNGSTDIGWCEDRNFKGVENLTYFYDDNGVVVQVDGNINRDLNDVFREKARKSQDGNGLVDAFDETS